MSLLPRPKLRIAIAALAGPLVLASAAVAQAPPAVPAPAPPPAAAAPAQAQPAAPSPAVMLIMDGSGSMWGKIDGSKEPKIITAREALRAPLGKVAAKARLGLMSFGHRRQGACGDVEVISAPEQGPLDRITGALDKLNPKGKGPIALSLREAGKALIGKGPASVVLVHDNADNCQQDVCAAADELGRAQIKVFAVGIGLEGDEPGRMTCVAKATGGRFVNVTDAAALTAALQESVDLAMLGRIEPPAAEKRAEPAKEEVAKAPNALPANAPPGLALAALLGTPEGGIVERVDWRVSKEGGGNVLATTAGEVFEKLPPGKYTIEARAGLVSARQTVEVGANGPTQVKLPLQAGLLKIAVRAARSADPLGAAMVSLLPAVDKKAVAGAAPLWIVRAGEAQIVVPPGDYVVRAEIGLVRQDLPLTVAAGARLPADILLAAGRLLLSAQASDDGEPLDNVTFIVAEDDPDAPQGRREIARSAAPRPELVLRAGTYYATARLGPNEVRSRIAVGAGDTVKKAIVLGLSRLTVSVAMDGAADMAGQQPILVRISRLDTAAKEVGRSTERRADFMLTPGRYRIEVVAGAQNARAEGEVELKPAHNAQASVKLEAAAISLRAVESAGGPAVTDAFWEIRDRAGRVVWRTSQAEPKALLAPGRYVVRSELRARSLEKIIDVAAGEARTLEVGP